MTVIFEGMVTTKVPNTDALAKMKEIFGNHMRETAAIEVGYELKGPDGIRTPERSNFVVHTPTGYVSAEMVAAEFGFNWRDYLTPNGKHVNATASRLNAYSRLLKCRPEELIYWEEEKNTDGFTRMMPRFVHPEIGCWMVYHHRRVTTNREKQAKVLRAALIACMRPNTARNAAGVQAKYVVPFTPMPEGVDEPETSVELVAQEQSGLTGDLKIVAAMNALTEAITSANGTAEEYRDDVENFVRIVSALYNMFFSAKTTANKNNAHQTGANKKTSESTETTTSKGIRLKTPAITVPSLGESNN